MTLEEAIEQIEREYRENRSGWLYALKRGETKYAERCRKCDEEHRQLAEWLRELQERRKQPEIIRCSECVHSSHTVDGKIRYCKRHARYKLKDYFCGEAERRTDG